MNDMIDGVYSTSKKQEEEAPRGREERLNMDDPMPRRRRRSTDKF